VLLVDAASAASGDVARIVCALLAGRADLATAHVIVPASPDGRDLAPLLAHRLGRSLYAGATLWRDQRVRVARVDGQVLHEHQLTGPSVITLVPGQRGVSSLDVLEPPHVEVLSTQSAPVAPPSPGRRGVESVEVLPPDPQTADLTEAARIVAGGQGLGSTERFAQLGRIGARLGASLGGTRVASDAGWIPFERQIGTTGVIVDPDLYLAFAISGATQHTSGLGDPRHVISVNLDASCPMMAMSDLAIVSDANAVLDALEARLAEREGSR
jgi:electron transfer flavoprotein alpha subunit